MKHWSHNIEQACKHTSYASSKQARKPRSYASSKLEPNDLINHKCKATSKAKKKQARKATMIIIPETQLKGRAGKACQESFVSKISTLQAKSDQANLGCIGHTLSSFWTGDQFHEAQNHHNI